MKILLINPYYHPNDYGGTETVVKLIAENMKDSDEVAVYTVDSDADDLKKERIADVTIYRGSGGNFRIPLLHSDYSRWRNAVVQRVNFRIKAEFTNVIKDFEPDVVHTHNVYGFSTMIWRYAKREGIPVIHTIHDYWMLRWDVVLFTRLNSRFVDFVTAPSEPVQKEFQSAKVFTCACTVIPNGIPIDILHHIGLVSRKNLVYDVRPFRFIYVGRLEAVKGVKQLVKAFQKLKRNDVELRICGKGSLQKYVVKAAKEDSKIVYQGYLDKKALNRMYGECDVLVIPSLWEEPFGMVAIEAFYNGLTVIASNRGGLKDIINYMECGTLINPEDGQELENAINKYCDRDTIASDLVKIKKHIGHFCVEEQMQSMREIYRKAVACTKAVRGGREYLFNFPEIDFASHKVINHIAICGIG